MGTSPPIEFWFDLSSPYAYFAALKIKGLAERHGRKVHWRPFLLGVLFRVTGNAPLTGQPLKGDYCRRDWERLARMDGVPFVMRSDFPVATQAPARMILAVERIEGRDLAAWFARSLFEAMFGAGLRIEDAAVAADVGRGIGLDAAMLRKAAEDPELKSALRDQCAEAERRGIFGSPWFIVDGEPFWGADRLPMVERWLTHTTSIGPSTP
ncbi:2-hydroxychromene-2-carboxylate isomerase [Sphingomonas sp. 36D10-4-7]|uniref:2-hydroxychromene-2-carboxylate isomerase n=1 Tax=Sphingomonas corticis TaxID=2722791 RepID=A0ABX1CQS5_9SPHN|nr:2-hydroxychromene-2-carboxylate isomerase [Sphingomonas corticis]